MEMASSVGKAFKRMKNTDYEDFAYQSRALEQEEKLYNLRFMI